MPSSTPSKDKTDTRLAKGQRTRDRLMEEALRLFATKGHDAVGTRELAAAAGTNIASIAFHFGGKDRLYCAVIEGVAAELSRHHQAALRAAATESDALGEEPRQRARRAMAKLLAALLTSNRSQWMSLLLQREFITPTALFARIYTEAVEPSLRAIATLVGAATGRDSQSMDNRILAFSLFIMASSFSRNKNTFLRFSEMTEFTPEVVADICRVVADFVENGLSPRP
jgi:AcrR family transcriptional regulator